MTPSASTPSRIIRASASRTFSGEKASRSRRETGVLWKSHPIRTSEESEGGLIAFSSEDVLLAEDEVDDRVREENERKTHDRKESGPLSTKPERAGEQHRGVDADRQKRPHDLHVPDRSPGLLD